MIALVLTPGGGGSGHFQTSDGKRFKFAFSSDGSAQRRARERAERHVRENPNPEFQHPDGRPKSAAQRQEYREKKDATQHEIAAKQKVREAKKAVKDEPNPWRRRIAREAAQGRLHSESGRLHKKRLDLYERKALEWDATRAKKQEAERIKKNPRVKLLVEFAQLSLKESTPEEAEGWNRVITLAEAGEVDQGWQEAEPLSQAQYARWEQEAGARQQAADSSQFDAAEAAEKTSILKEMAEHASQKSSAQDS